VAFLSTAIFWLTDLDIRAAAIFYHPDNSLDPWYEANDALWNFFYNAAPVITATAAIGGVAVIIGSSVWSRMSTYRIYAALVVLTLVVGPGILINAVFKDHWGRPRPRQIQTLGGDQVYVPPLMMGKKGKSFPAGHSSVGFALCTFWLIWRRRQPWLAKGALLVALVVGGMMGIGRMAAGGHFLSDVMWSAYLTLFAALMVYYLLLRMHRHEADSEPVRTAHTAWQTPVYTSLGVAVLTGSLLAFPVHKDIQSLLDQHSMAIAPQIAELVVDRANIEIQLNSGGPYLAVQGNIRGFGLPTNRITSQTGHAESPVPTVSYRLEQKGVFTELDSRIKVRLDARKLSRLIVRLDKGDIVIVSDARLAHLPTLDLRTKQGRVRQPHAQAEVQQK